MENIRFKALGYMMTRRPGKAEATTNRPPSEYFGEMTFNQEAMKKFLTEEAYKALQASIEKGQRIDRRIADQVASSLKAWA